MQMTGIAGTFIFSPLFGCTVMYMKRNNVSVSVSTKEKNKIGIGYTKHGLQTDTDAITQSLLFLPGVAIFI